MERYSEIDFPEYPKKSKVVYSEKELIETVKRFLSLIEKDDKLYFSNPEWQEIYKLQDLLGFRKG